MPKKKPVPKLKKPKPQGRMSKTVVLGQPMHELSIWVFDAPPDVIEFHSNQICRAFLLHFGIKNFGVKSFGLEEEN